MVSFSSSVVSVSREISDIYYSNSLYQSSWSRHKFSQMCIRMLKNLIKFHKASMEKSRESSQGTDKPSARRPRSNFTKKTKTSVKKNVVKSRDSSSRSSTGGRKISLSCVVEENTVVDLSWANYILDGSPDDCQLNWGKTQPVHISTLLTCLEGGKRRLISRVDIRRNKRHRSTPTFHLFGTKMDPQKETIQFFSERDDEQILISNEFYEAEAKGASYSSSRISPILTNAGRSIFDLWTKDVEFGSNENDDPGNTQTVVTEFDDFNRCFQQSPITAWESIYSSVLNPDTDSDVLVEEVRTNVETSNLNVSRSSFDMTTYRTVQAMLRRLPNVNLQRVVKAVDKGLMTGSMVLRFLKSSINVFLNIITCGIYGLTNQIIEALPSLWQLITGTRDNVMNFIRSPRQLINSSINNYIHDSLLVGGIKVFSRRALRERMLEQSGIQSVTARSAEHGLSSESYNQLSELQQLEYLFMTGGWVNTIRFIYKRNDLLKRRNFQQHLLEIKPRVNYDPNELFKRIVFLGFTQSSFWSFASWWKKSITRVYLYGYFHGDEKLESEYQRFIKKIE